MTEAKKKELLGWGCTILGGIFVVAGLVLFIMSNRMNLQMRKTEATILAMYEMELDTGVRHTMLDLSYRVGDRVVMTTYDYPGVLPKEEATIDIYYDIKEPEMVFECEWLFEPLLVLALGILILVPGLFLKGFFKLDQFKTKEPPKDAGHTMKEMYKARNSVMENLLPMLAGILFLIFGIIMLCIQKNRWAWMFIVGGAIELVYISLEFIPAAITWTKLSKIEKVKVKAKVYDVDMDIEKENASDKNDEE